MIEKIKTSFNNDFFNKTRFFIIFFLSLILLLFYYLLVSNSLIYPTISPMVSDSKLFLFADWSVIVKANLCKDLWYSDYSDIICDPFSRPHVYGEILLYFPFVEKLQNLYLIFLPIFFIFIFIFSIFLMFNLGERTNLVVPIIILLSFPVLLVSERANIDILIFVFVFLISYFRSVIFITFSIILITLSKFYPIVLSIIFLLEKKIGKLIISILITNLVVFAVFYLQFDQMLKILENIKQVTPYGIYNFSFNGSIKYVNNFNLLINDRNFSLFVFLLIAIVPSVLLFLSTIKSCQKIRLSSFVNLNDFEDRLFFLSAIILISCFFPFSNFVYREIFIIGIIPFAIKVKENFSDQKILSLYFYLLIFKFLTSFPITFIYMNKVVENLKLIVIFKYTIDFYLMFMTLGIFLILFIKSLNNLKINIAISFSKNS